MVAIRFELVASLHKTMHYHDQELYKFFSSILFRTSNFFLLGCYLFTLPFFLFTLRVYTIIGVRIQKLFQTKPC